MDGRIVVRGGLIAETFSAANARQDEGRVRAWLALGLSIPIKSVSHL